MVNLGHENIRLDSKGLIPYYLESWFKKQKTTIF